MKNQWIFLTIILAFMILLSSCEDFVTNIDPLIDQTEDEQLNDESQIPFTIVGVQTQFGETHDELMMIADLFSDDLWFTRGVKGSSYGTYEEIDGGILRLDNSSVEGPETEIGRLRLYGDDLVTRVGLIDFSNAALKKEALYTGYLFGGVARYYYATYFGLTENQGGGCIDGGPFIPSDQMYDLAIAKFEAALTQAADDETKRMVNSLIARCYLIKEDFTNALNYAQNGMINGDPPFQAEHNAADDPNYYWQQAGHGRTQAVADYRFNDYITADSTEANRVLIEEIVGLDRRTIYYMQNEYPDAGTGVNLISWQENELMLAELSLRGFGAGDALTLINNVRTFYGITALGTADMAVLIEERDKELFATGLRLVDQRRFDADYGTWHLPAGGWKYLPITDNERNANDNL